MASQPVSPDSVLEPRRDRDDSLPSAASAGHPRNPAPPGTGEPPVPAEVRGASPAASESEVSPGLEPAFESEVSPGPDTGPASESDEAPGPDASPASESEATGLDAEPAPEIDPELLRRRREALRYVRKLGDPVLRAQALPVDRYDDRLREQVDRMGVLMEDAMGVGLAATQLGLLQRLLVYRVQPESPVIALVNPEIEWSGED